MNLNLRELGAFVGPEGYISATTISTALGLMFPGIGVIAGSVIGGLVDSVFGARKRKKMRRRMKRAFYAALLKRYQTQIFISALQRMGVAMIYLQSLGFKPGSEQYDQMLKKKLFSDIGYKGKCAINLYDPSQKERKVLASINHKGEVIPYSPSFDVKLGPKWAKACKELHKAALQAWADEKKEQIIYQRKVTQESEEARRKSITKFMVNGGLIMLMMGYSYRQKMKLKKLREAKP